MAYLEDHQLYYKKSCPYCVRVLRFLESNGITLDLRDTMQPGIKTTSSASGAKSKCPAS